MTFYVNYITYLLVTLMSSVVRYSGHYNLILRTIQYYIPKLLYSIGIQHGAVRMSQKNENNSAESNSRSSSSEESGDKKGRTTTHQKKHYQYSRRKPYKKRNYGGDDLLSMSK